MICLQANENGRAKRKALPKMLCKIRSGANNGFPWFPSGTDFLHPQYGHTPTRTMAAVFKKRQHNNCKLRGQHVGLAAIAHTPSKLRGPYEGARRLHHSPGKWTWKEPILNVDADLSQIDSRPAIWEPRNEARRTERRQIERPNSSHLLL